MGRPVSVTSIAFSQVFAQSDPSLEHIFGLIEEEAEKKPDLILLPELWSGFTVAPEEIDGRISQKISQIAARYGVYIISPIYRTDEQGRRINTAMLFDRRGILVMIYDKVFPYLEEFNAAPPASPGENVPAFDCDFGRLGIAICFDANFPEVWKALDDQNVDLVAFCSAYSAGSQLQAHALNHHYPIVSCTDVPDCTVIDINGKETAHFEGEDGLCISRVTLDLDRCIFHENYNTELRDKLLAEHGDDVEQEFCWERENWFVLRSRNGSSAKQLAARYGLEELRSYKRRSRDIVNKRRGCILC